MAPRAMQQAIFVWKIFDYPEKIYNFAE